MMWTDTTMDKPSMSKAKVGNNYATLYNTNSLLGLTSPIEEWNIWLKRSDSAIFRVFQIEHFGKYNSLRKDI